jgi:hypothetical protein
VFPTLLRVVLDPSLILSKSVLPVDCLDPLKVSKLKKVVSPVSVLEPDCRKDRWQTAGIGE